MTGLARLAKRAPAPVFAAIGPGRQASAERLLARPSLRRASTPRDAALLLVAGEVPGDAIEALSAVHDQVPKPRTTLRWLGEDMETMEGRIAEAWHDLSVGAEGEPDRLPDEPPNPWKGIGPHGQGGEGMMGGTPYGRPMAMTGPDVRDGLRLDRYTARVGPFAPMLPPGLTVETTLQGDVICEVRVVRPPFEQPADADAPELCAARLLRLLGLEGPADQLMRGRGRAAFWVRGAVPKGLGRIGGSDARERLAAWLEGQGVTVAGRSDRICPDRSGFG